MPVEKPLTLETGQEQEGKPVFTSEDGTPATWLEVPPERTRRKALAWRAGIGLMLAIILWGLQLNDGVLDIAHGWVGAVPFAIGLAWGLLAYRNGVDAVRRYTTVRVNYTVRERFYRALPWWVTSIAITGLVWWVQLEHAQFTEYWWYAWPMLPFFLVGIGLFRLRASDELSPSAKKAKTYFNMLAEQTREQSGRSSLDDFLEKPAVRYALAALLLYGAYYFAVEFQARNSGWIALGAFVGAGALAHELSKWLFGLALIGVIIWAFIAGISALPVSAALIIGALIIASAMQK
ncbi:hypothetical protein PSUB009319_05800 [Ralstonia sp. SET104]|nr:hypothetical protein PSUB009319_05800 [Ralstonia sp. SET104]